MHTDSATGPALPGAALPGAALPGLTLPGLVLSGPDLIELDATAVRASVDLVTQLPPARPPRPTPCAGWTLHGLLAHLTTQHYGFAAAAAGQEGPGPWRLRRPGPDPARDCRDAGGTVLVALRAAGGAGPGGAAGPDRPRPGTAEALPVPPSPRSPPPACAPGTSRCPSSR